MNIMTYDEYVRMFGPENLERLDVFSGEGVGAIYCTDSGAICIVERREDMF